jgi:hypothetical protein
MDLKLISSPAFHPHFLITQPPTRPTPASRYHATFTLPDAIFVDRDELIDLWSQSGHIEWDLKPTKIDIERPVRAGVQASVLRLSWSGDETLDLPLHARYLRPNEDASEVITLFQEGDVVSGWNCNGLNGRSGRASSADSSRYLMSWHRSPHSFVNHSTRWSNL